MHEASAPPPGDPVVLRVQEGRLAVGGFSAACSVTPGDAPSLLPFDASPAVVLGLGSAHDPAALDAAGLSDAVVEIRLRARESAAAAAEHLAWLGVTEEELLRWILERACP